MEPKKKPNVAELAFKAIQALGILINSFRGGERMVGALGHL